MSAKPKAAPIRWLKSSRSSGNGSCVEIAFMADAVMIRDSKDPFGPTLSLEPDCWRMFIGSVQRGTFDRVEL
jgi:hypothetical protein